MLLVKAYDEIRQPRQRRDIPGGFIGCTSYFVDVPEDKSVDSPMAFLAEGDPDRELRTHFHRVDQFQLIYRGSGTLAQHALAPGAVHFARAYTPYGPLRNGSQEGLAYLTLRAHRDPGARYIPDSRAELDAVPDRSPWQVTSVADFNFEPGAAGVALRPMQGLQDPASGLAAWCIRMQPGARTVAPEPSRGEGQYILVTKGGIQHEGRLRNGLAVVWVSKEEPAFELVAGPQGMEGLVLNFPAVAAAKPQAAPAADGEEFKVWLCVLCGFLYDEAAGMPDHDIAPGTRWADVPESFGCPDCSATKADFEMVEL